MLRKAHLKFAAMPYDGQFGFQKPYSPIMEGIISFHDDLVIFLTFILFFVIYMLGMAIYLFNYKKNNNIAEGATFTHNSTLEIIWTIIPALILINLAIPSFSLLYSVDEIVEPMLNIKVIGHQWYWSYEILGLGELNESIWRNEDSGFEATEFDSYMVADEDLKPYKYTLRKNPRLLTVDNYVLLPVNKNVRLLVTSADVIHSWAIPSLGVKLDACPGRLNQTSLLAERSGFYYGQCSEICGVNHGFMPIGIFAFNILGKKLPSSIVELIFLVENLESKPTNKK